MNFPIHIELATDPGDVLVINERQDIYRASGLVLWGYADVGKKADSNHWTLPTVLLKWPQR